MTRSTYLLVNRSFLLAGMLGATSALAASWQDSEAGQAFSQRQETLRALGQNAGLSKSLSEGIFSSGGFEPADPCMQDRDGDGLADCVETATGRFINAQDTGTDPDNPDSDHDGLLDGEEVHGSETGLDLPAMGVNPLRRDLLIEYDWFESDHGCGPHSQRPSAAAMQRLATMFANAPLQNPDGSTGIHLVQDYGQGGLYTGGNRDDGYSAILPGALDGTFYAIKQANFNPARLGYFRYVLMPHQYAGGSSSSGYAEVVGDDAIVALQCSNVDDYVTRTVAHEVGHLLGLLHGGFESCNRKPNYNSLMNYRFQFTGVDMQCDALGDPDGDDFSVGTRLSLDEAALNEPQGVCGSQPVDWNTDGLFDENLAHDLGGCGSSLSKLHDFDDWSNLTFAGLVDRTGKLSSVQTEVDCGAPLPKH